MESTKRINILMLGGNGCGKSSLLHRYVGDETVPLTTVGIDWRIKTVRVDGEDISVKILDTAGQARFDRLSQQFYPQAHGILLVLDLTCPYTAADVRRLIKDVMSICPQKVPIMLVGNKIDLAEAQSVYPDQYQDLCVDYIETSAKTGANVDACFHQILKAIL